MPHNRHGLPVLTPTDLPRSERRPYFNFSENRSHFQRCNAQWRTERREQAQNDRLKHLARTVNQGDQQS